jgi:hypothetical protein
MANSNGWGDGAANNAIGWGQGANNAIAWGDSHAKSWAGATDIVGLTTDPDAQAFITAAAITDPTQQAAIDNLVKGLKSDNIWTKMKAIYPFVGGTASTHKWNLKDPRDLDAAFRLVFNGGWTHSSNGATPNGTNGYADTKLVPSSVLAQNSASMGIYSRTNSASTLFTDFGAYDTKGFWQRTRRTNDTGGGYANTTNDFYTANTSSLGLFCLSRTSSANFSFYKNGTGTLFTSTSTGIASVSVYIGAGNLNAAAVEFSNRQYAFQYVSDGLTDTEAANLYTRVQAFQTALSRNV